MEEILLEVEEKMEKAISQFEHHLNTVRTGRANPNMLENIEVDYYGSPTPVNQIASISVSEGRILVIKPYDSQSLKDIEKAINESNINLPPNNDGTVIRLSVPALTEETRRNYCKDVSKFAEEAKVLIRNIRRDFNDKVKKDKAIPEDVSKSLLDEIQKETDKFISKIEVLEKSKEKEIMTI